MATTPATCPPLPTFPCPRCRARFERRPEVCPRCRKWLGDYWPEPLPPRERVPWRFGLASIMLIIYLFGVGLGLLLNEQWGPLGLLVLLIGPATVIRAAPIYADRRIRRGRRFFPGDFAVLLESALRVVVILVAAIFAAIATVYATTLVSIFGFGNLFLLSPNGTVVGGAIAGLSGLLTVFLVGWRIFPPKD